MEQFIIIGRNILTGETWEFMTDFDSRAQAIADCRHANQMEGADHVEYELAPR